MQGNCLFQGYYSHNCRNIFATNKGWKLFHGWVWLITIFNILIDSLVQVAAVFLVSVCPSQGQLIGEFDKNALKDAAEKEKDSK